MRFSILFVLLILESYRIFIGVSCSADFQCYNSESQTCHINQTNCMCDCRPGFYSIQDGDLLGCLKVKTFSGMITFIGVSTNQIQSALVKELLQIMFNDSQYFIDANVLALRTNELTATYELLFENSMIVNASYVQNVFTQRYACPGSNVIIALSTGSLTVDLSQSCFTVVSSNSSILCGNSFQDHCDLSSTNCVAGSDGYVTCPCRPDFLSLNSTACTTSKRCEFDADCNHPLGSCVKVISGVQTCTCTWGVAGQNCESAWLLIFTIVTVILGFVIICLVLAIVFVMRRNLSSSTAFPSTPYEHQPTAGPKYSFSHFPPGVMRAKLADPSVYENENAENPTTSRDSLSASTRPNGLKQQKNSYLNLAFERNEQNSSSVAPPKKTKVDLQPTNYF